LSLRWLGESPASAVAASCRILWHARYIREYLTRPKVRVQARHKAAQLLWLEQAPAASKAAWKIVVGQHQLYTVTGQNHDYPDMIEPFKPLRDRYGFMAMRLDADVLAFSFIGAGGARIYQANTPRRI